MSKVILLTGATDGIGLEAARKLAKAGHSLILHGRSATKLKAVADELSPLSHIETCRADLSELEAVQSLAQDIENKCPKLDVIINNAGVLRTDHALTSAGYDIRFMVNAIAPYLLTKLEKFRLNLTHQ